jgi:hypothetical protein
MLRLQAALQARDWLLCLPGSETIDIGELETGLQNVTRVYFVAM